MSDKAMTGPELYKVGIEYLRQVLDQPQGADVRELCAIAQAAFTGAHAAAFGQMASDEGDSPELGKAWREAIGDPA